MSRKKNVAKIAKARLENPTDTTREIEEKTWIDHSTVSRIDKQLQQIATKDDRIIWLTDKDFEIQNLVQWETVRRLTTKPEEIRDPDLVRFWEFAMKRYQLFRWEATEIVEVQDLSEERKAIIAKRYINV